MAGLDGPAVYQLRSLLTLAEELHFGRAAARLYITQPALSQQIRSLEQRLGVRLFTRTSRRVELTPMGQALLPRVRNVVGAADELRDAARCFSADDDAVALRLGLAGWSAALEATHQVVTAITAQHPDVKVELKVLDMAEQSTALAMGKVDAAFVYLPVPAGCHAEPLTTEPRVVCLSSSDPLADRPTLRLADLADRAVVGLAPDVSHDERSFWATDPRPDGTPVSYTDHQVRRIDSLLSAVSFDGAIAFLPAVATELFPRPDIRYRPVVDLEPCTFAIVWPTSHRANPHTAVLESICRQLREQGLPAGTKRASDETPASPGEPGAGPGTGTGTGTGIARSGIRGDAAWSRRRRLIAQTTIPTQGTARATDTGVTL
ncbi:LysR family transcriptional regulator [Streptomyces zagrosensis]|uniref:DNA-binding transcriptional LysR family regulator n=1 Tax=Streptomyces zagrosensis TaxID=1042984 RepID=A0A7W9V2C8_9ACTN|nr:LysR family transcriptional regulator [Streptomyces zagrosensis]MBB5938714.1 DNA-binding transcriptional LysR family regulator [Streptomyces zagrosensis]